MKLFIANNCESRVVSRTARWPELLQGIRSYNRSIFIIGCVYFVVHDCLAWVEPHLCYWMLDQTWQMFSVPFLLCPRGRVCPCAKITVESFNIRAGSALQASEPTWDLSNTHSCVLCCNTANKTNKFVDGNMEGEEHRVQQGKAQGNSNVTEPLFVSPVLPPPLTHSTLDKWRSSIEPQAFY